MNLHADVFQDNRESNAIVISDIVVSFVIVNAERTLVNLRKLAELFIRCIERKSCY